MRTPRDPIYGPAIATLLRSSATRSGCIFGFPLSLAAWSRRCLAAPRHLGDARDDPAMGLKIRAGNFGAGRIRRRAPLPWRQSGTSMEVRHQHRREEALGSGRGRSTRTASFSIFLSRAGARQERPAKRLFPQAPQEAGSSPYVCSSTDKPKELRPAAKREIMPGVEHRQHKGLNNRGPKTPINRPDGREADHEAVQVRRGRFNRFFCRP